ncbi:NAD(P)H-dependent oxidoreductase [Aggregatibacter actinomycetemcomitans]|uniref:FMN dependent NADH:quinone oxidoreductase n=1 Tax=Aggregatibacter actinomycetemcomitans serotype e str. SC1083 TaxID=907488 RepID=G4A7J1_AGGAC|nr:NAD(P)H-dependent oxidoreductase [Aggregatibacter actinomycetemcomitans]EGY34395.1 fmn-dependent NADH-azoreductase [Aggregatibacter actinomycetemcomitans serotype e str. SC1083]KYK72598.1 azoreductase [Aggregatibacter actinomycetemcomitans serotype e str. SA3096]KYK78646.1 azoreductase [Aggregatibacter actinomycetemcomitans serotype e str. SC936]MBN6070762.1 NAD(P)H-dependent oxidoreductase [Aggregatibacter actinomycetemcomitans]MBN6080360.1 NAD(P)H-dependent oxidoreductase [Aggregatibacter
MDNVLILKSSILAGNSQTNQLSDYLESKLAGKNIVVRDLAVNQLPHFDATATTALRGQPTTAEENALLALSDELVAEIKNANTIIINAPMYNFNIPTQLKSYFDFIARPRVTFQYTEKGPEGLLTDKKAVVLAAFGGLHQNQSSDIVTAYLKMILGFVGITDVQFVYAEGIGFGPEAVEKAQAQAKAEIDKIVAAL